MMYYTIPYDQKHKKFYLTWKSHIDVFSANLSSQWDWGGENKSHMGKMLQINVFSQLIEFRLRRVASAQRELTHLFIIIFLNFKFLFFYILYGGHKFFLAGRQSALHPVSRPTSQHVCGHRCTQPASRRQTASLRRCQVPLTSVHRDRDWWGNANDIAKLTSEESGSGRPGTAAVMDGYIQCGGL